MIFREINETVHGLSIFKYSVFSILKATWCKSIIYTQYITLLNEYIIYVSIQPCLSIESMGKYELLKSSCPFVNMKHVDGNQRLLIINS